MIVVVCRSSWPLASLGEFNVCPSYCNDKNIFIKQLVSVAVGLDVAEEVHPGRKNLPRMGYMSDGRVLAGKDTLAWFAFLLTSTVGASLARALCQGPPSGQCRCQRL